MNERGKKTLAVRCAAAAAVMTAVLVCFTQGVENLERGGSEEGRRQLEQAIRRGAVACYAAEGIYPADISYLEEHYGLRIPRDVYTVDYQVFASNLMPEIMVLDCTQ